MYAHNNNNHNHGHYIRLQDDPFSGINDLAVLVLLCVEVQLKKDNDVGWWQGGGL